MQRPRRPVADRALDAWPLVLALLLCWPLLTSGGYPLARDLVFVPHQPLTDASLGLGDAAPRAVPVDALVSLASHVVDGGVLARVVLPVVLATAGWGAHRLVRPLGTTARLAVAGFAVWNPYVVERLALGQWALLASYAALPWLAVAADRWRRERRRADLAAVVLWTAVASITPTGGVVAVVTVLVLGSWRPAVPAALLQLSWLLPSFVGAAGLTSDPDGVNAFAARAEAPGGVLVSLLGLGGAWDRDSVPATRESWWGLVAAVVAVAVVVLGWRGLRSFWGSCAPRALGLGLGGLLLAAAGATGPGTDVLRWLVTTVPGAGLLRDTQKYDAWWALLVVCTFGVVVDRAVSAARRSGPELVLSTGLVAVALPGVLMPDATRVVWPTVDPVTLPPSLTAAAARVARNPADVVVLPWASYRRFPWGHGPASDPAVRMLDADVVTDDSLRVGSMVVAGESARAAAVARELARPDPDLASLGFGWRLTWSDDLRGVTLTRLDDPAAVPDPVAPAARWLVRVVDLLLAAAVVLAGVLRVAARKQEPHPSR